MPITDLYSTRSRTDPDVWNFDAPPPKLRVQISQIVASALGPTFNPRGDDSSLLYKLIEDAVAHEHGIDSVGRGREPDERIHHCLRNGETELFIDLVEFCCRLLARVVGSFTEHQLMRRQIKTLPKQAIEEINERCKRAGFGYRFEGNDIVRVDNELLHQNITKPALAILLDPRFAGANSEYHDAHEHYKANEYRDCAVDALNALESTMKIICDLKLWEYNKGSRATDLLKVLRKNNLFPVFASIL